MHQKQNTNLYVISCSLTQNCHIHQRSLIIHITHGKLFYRLCEWIFPLRSFIYDSMKDDDIRIPPEFRNEQILEYKGKVTYDANHNHQNRFVGTGGHQFF